MAQTRMKGERLQMTAKRKNVKILRLYAKLDAEWPKLEKYGKSQTRFGHRAGNRFFLAASARYGIFTMKEATQNIEVMAPL